MSSKVFSPINLLNATNVGDFTVRTTSSISDIERPLVNCLSQHNVILDVVPISVGIMKTKLNKNCYGDFPIIKTKIPAKASDFLDCSNKNISNGNLN